MIAAFDLGIKNFAFAVKNDGEFIHLKNSSLVKDDLTKNNLNTLKKKDLVEMMTNLNLDSNSGKARVVGDLPHGQIDLSVGNKIKKKDLVDLISKKLPKGKKEPPTDLGLALFKIMDDNKHIWNLCDTFLIERQMAINLQALKLSHYLEAYLKIFFPTKKVLNFNASMKTKKLGATGLKTKKHRKEWTVEFARSVLNGDGLRCFESLPKQDDVADCVCMIEAFQLV